MNETSLVAEETAIYSREKILLCLFRIHTSSVASLGIFEKYVKKGDKNA